MFVQTSITLVALNCWQKLKFGLMWNILEYAKVTSVFKRVTHIYLQKETERHYPYLNELLQSGDDCASHAKSTVSK